MKRKIIWITIVIFIVTNSVLILLDDGGKVTRQAFITKWDKVFQSDIKEKIPTKGVAAYSGENYVYFDKSLGNFNEFLVEEGTIVQAGDPLFSYQVNDYYQTEAALTNELERLSGEVASIEDAISEMVSFRISNPSVPVVGDTNEDQTTVVVAPGEPVEAEVLKEQFILQKEQELAAVQEQERLIQSQLDELRSSGDTVTVESPFSGKVQEISSTLQDPIIRIGDTSLIVKGDLNETARVNVETGQQVEIMFDKVDQSFTGTISKLEEEPHEVGVDSESIYPFEVMFEEEQELDSILPGYHTDMMITVNESLNANTIHERYVSGKKVWNLQESGKLEKIAIEKGLHIGNNVEITKGLEAGDVVTNQKTHDIYAGMPFITPIKANKVPWLQISNYENWEKYFVMGILSR
ncbi:efflux RND transporter periplasmic adaptor subunit [Ornithinibacillus scapharcae]|uniref:efflux RND transporter periplasmic adaptor subunit n=1 Tax=Ornithinibacillus scapharcae TaxID=1147159 RepID=UPI000225B601|nr:HlyD family efflux transporter periplasmic adaptor subunit [Ornithinibacillus scapharcae]